jgi:hypothetical protein
VDKFWWCVLYVFAWPLSWGMDVSVGFGVDAGAGFGVRLKKRILLRVRKAERCGIDVCWCDDCGI